MSKSVTLKPGKARSLLRRHPWIFAGAIARSEGKLHPGDTVEVLDADGGWLARAAWSPQSQIRARVWTFEREDVVDDAFFLRRIEQALACRRALPGLAATDAMRLVAAESDGLPGIIVDRYAGVLVCQLLSAGAERHRDKLLQALKTVLPDCAIHERSDVDVRKKEGLEPVMTEHVGEIPAQVAIRENELQYLVDVRAGHKTGFYLDQRDNRLRAGMYAGGRRVLNCFSYTAAMGLSALRGGATHVVNVDTASAAHDIARQQLELNGFGPESSEFLDGDVFSVLRQYRAEGRRFDMVVLDPPKFADSRAAVQRACRGYKDINLLAMQLLNPGGVLLTFSCSGLLPEDLFRKVVADAALDAGRNVRYLERLGQASDHPVSSAFPEGAYLKGLVCRVD